MDELELSVRLLVALLLTAAIGYNRERSAHAAGLRTHMLVGLGAALFTVLSSAVFNNAVIAAQIITGIGFLGAGAIMHRDQGGAHGLTTAADIWTTAAVGMAVGAGKYLLATISTLLIMVTLVMVKGVEKRFLDRKTPSTPAQVDCAEPSA